MNLLGTTGTRSISDAAAGHELIEYLGSTEMHLYLSSFDGFVSGGCVGWDALFGVTVRLHYPSKEHIVVVPADRSRVDPWWEKFDIGSVRLIEMPEGTDYRARNEKIVALSTRLFYCADYPEEHGKSKRSGTWMTVRIARKHGITPQGIILHNIEE